jgi:hypothetical protein
MSDRVLSFLCMGSSEFSKKINRRNFLSQSTLIFSSSAVFFTIPKWGKQIFESGFNYTVETLFSYNGDTDIRKIFSKKHLWCEAEQLEKLHSLFERQGLLSEKVDMILKDKTTAIVRRRFKNSQVYAEYCKLISDNNLVSEINANKIGLSIIRQQPMPAVG